MLSKRHLEVRRWTGLAGAMYSSCLLFAGCGMFNVTCQQRATPDNGVFDKGGSVPVENWVMRGCQQYNLTDTFVLRAYKEAPGITNELLRASTNTNETIAANARVLLSVTLPIEQAERVPWDTMPIVITNSFRTELEALSWFWGRENIHREDSSSDFKASQETGSVEVQPREQEDYVRLLSLSCGRDSTGGRLLAVIVEGARGWSRQYAVVLEKTVHGGHWGHVALCKICT